MMIYPVVSGESFGHMDSFKNLVGNDAPAKQQLDKVSLEKHVDEDSSPAFIVHTATDDVVNVRNSLALGEAYAKAGKKFEMHIYPDAPHGAALGNDITECGCAKWADKSIAKWVEQAAEWAENEKAFC